MSNGFVGSWKEEKYRPEDGAPGKEEQSQSCFRGENYREQCYEDADLHIRFFGVIYNKAAVSGLEMKGEAEIVAHILRQKGVEGLAGLDGSFTCIIRESRGVRIIRDHHGTSFPVYYNDAWFASSLALLQRTPGFSAAPCRDMLSEFLMYGYVPSGRSALAGVSKMGAGEMLTFTSSGIARTSLYPTRSIAPAPATAESADSLAARYGELHREAIRRRIGDSRDVGILLSGGYDSGGNLAALRQFYSGEVRSFSIGFKGDNWTELPLARCMSEAFGTRHTEYEIDGSEIDALPEIVAFLGDPFVEGGLMVNYTVMRLIGAEKPDVILGGDGSDQYFGTSGREIALHFLLSKYGLKPFAKAAYGLLSRPAFEDKDRFYRLRFHLDKVLHILQGDLFGFPRFRLEKMLRDPGALAEGEVVRPDTSSFERLYTQHAYATDVEKVINQVILFKASQMAALFGNTIAFPYMDLELYRFLQTVPVGYKCRGANVKAIAKGQGIAKFLLKHHYKPFLPEAITSKKKQGGFAPMPLFFREPARRNRIADYILQSAVCRDFLRREAVEAFVGRYDREAADGHRWFWYQQNQAIQYFNLFTLALWWERFVQGDRGNLF